MSGAEGPRSREEMMAACSVRNLFVIVAATAVAVLGTRFTTPAFPQSKEEVALVSWGGSYQDAQRKAYFEPFMKATGIRVIDGVGPQIERSRAEVTSGHPSYDIAVTNQTFNLIGVEQ